MYLLLHLNRMRGLRSIPNAGDTEGGFVGEYDE